MCSGTIPVSRRPPHRLCSVHADSAVARTVHAQTAPVFAPPGYVSANLYMSQLSPGLYAYRRFGVRISPFQMQMPILMTMYTSSLIQLLHFPFPTPVAAAPCFELVLRTSPPYRTSRSGYSTPPRTSSTHSNTPNSPYVACPCTQRSKRANERARFGLDEVINHGGGSPSRSRSHIRTRTTLIQPQQ